jgi:hypothetical protein
MNTHKGKQSPYDAPLAEAPLSPRLAFVVQFRAGSNGTTKSYTGRVEHMTSGHVTHFNSRAELWTFLTDVLAKEEQRSKEQESLSHLMTNKEEDDHEQV